jgi:chemotaxis protein MotA
MANWGQFPLTVFAIIGIVIVIAAILGGYLMEHGPLLVLVQPAELLIILGASIGTMLIGTPFPTLQRLLKGLGGIFRGDSHDGAFYLENLQMLYQLFIYARKSGLNALEPDVDEPEKSPVFSKYPKFLSNHHTVHFVCDTMRMFITGGIDPFELDQMMELDMDIHHQEEHDPVAALHTTADALPGLGIVAAVLGVVITMGALGGPPEEIGRKVAAALVGTFVGILMCYGFFGPMASRMARNIDAEARYYHVMRVGMLAFIKGSAPMLAVEFARRAVPSAVRPTFAEMETTCKAGGSVAPAVAA